MERFDVKYTLFRRIDKNDMRKVPLGKLCDEEPCYGTSSTAIQRTDEKQPKYIRITDFDDFGIPPEHEYMTVESYQKKHILQSGDLLFARSGATVGKTYYYDGSIGFSVFAGYCIRFRLDKNKILPKFAYWCTKTSSYISWVKGIQRPSGQPNINKEEYKSYEIILPSIQVQERLSTAMNEAEIRRTKKIQKAEHLLKSLSQYILEALHISINQYNFRLCSAVHLKDIKQDSTFSAEYYHPERMVAIQSIQSNSELRVEKLSALVDFCREIVNSSESGEPYLGLSGVESQTGELSGIIEEAKGQAFSYQENDILYGRLRPYLNKVWWAEQSGICSTEFHVMRIKNKSTLLPEYLSEIMRSDLILSQTKHMMTGNTHPRISNEDVKNLCIPIPAIAIQRDIVKEINSRRNQARCLRQEAEKEWTEAKAQFEKELLGE